MSEMTRTQDEMIASLHELIHEIEHKSDAESKKEHSDDDKAMRSKRK
jgi:hypothetical protein